MAPKNYMTELALFSVGAVYDRAFLHSRTRAVIGPRLQKSDFTLTL